MFSVLDAYIPPEEEEEEEDWFMDLRLSDVVEAWLVMSLTLFLVGY